MAESLKEALSRKHFQMVADTLKSIEDPKKRSELAKHHAQIFAKSNPRFDHKRFMAAANVSEEAFAGEMTLDEASLTHGYGIKYKDGYTTVDKVLDAIKVAMKNYKKGQPRPEIVHLDSGKRVHWDGKVKTEEAELEEVAKWRTNPKAYTQQNPGDSDDSEDYDYYHDNPKSTGTKTPVGGQGKDPLKNRHSFNKSFDTLKVGPRAGKIRSSDQRGKAWEIKSRLGTHHTPTLPESLAYEGEGTYTVHHGKTGELVHTGLSKHGAMEAAIKLHAKTGVKPKVYHRAISGYGGRSYGKPKQEIAIEGVVDMADKSNLTESERIAYKAAFRDALLESKKHAIGSTVSVGGKKGYVVSTGADVVDVMHHDSGKIESYHHSKVKAQKPVSESAEDFDYDFFVEGRVLPIRTHEPTKQDNIRNAVAYLRVKHAYYTKNKDSHNASMTKTDLDKWETMLHHHIKKFGKLSVPKVRSESYETKAAVQGSFNAPNSEYDTNPGYNVLGTEKIHGRIVKYVRMGSFFAPVMVTVDGEPFETLEGEVVKFAGQNAARDEMMAKLNPALQAAFDATQSGKGGQNHNEVEDSEDVIKPEAPVQESTNPDEWDDSLVEEITIVEGWDLDHSKLSPEESDHVKKHAIPQKTVTKTIGLAGLDGKQVKTVSREYKKNSSHVVLPYKTDEHRKMADGIAKKLGLKKYFRGPREKRSDGTAKASTKKAVAHSVALY
jgi:hypothetical protein